MKNKSIERKQAFSLSLLTSAIATTFINGPFTIIKEITPLKDSLAATFGHHWVGHGVVLFIIFVVLSLLFVPVYSGRSYTLRLFTKLSVLLVSSVFIMLVLTLGFFMLEFFE